MLYIGETGDHARSTYGNDYKPHVLEIYKLYIEMSDRLSARRQKHNVFFLTANAAIFTLFGYKDLPEIAERLPGVFWLMPCVGLLLCAIWFMVIRSYLKISGAKFAVILEIEKKLLPIQPYSAEWGLIGRSGATYEYKQLTSLEAIIPAGVFLIHLVVLGWVLFVVQTL